MVSKMKKDVEVLVIVVCDLHPDQIPDPKVMARVRRMIAELEGVIETYLAPNTADIGALASWEEEKIPTMVAKIKRIDGVSQVETKILVSLS